MTQMTTPVSWSALLTSGLTKTVGLLLPRPRPGQDPAGALYRRDPQAPPQRVITIEVDPNRQSLFQEVERKINQLLLLERGWDTRNAEPITREAVETAVWLLHQLTTPTSAVPQLFPLSDGGLALGWRVAGDEIEIEIDAHGQAIVLAVTAAEQIIAEGTLDLLEPDTTMHDTRQFLARMSAHLTG